MSKGFKQNYLQNVIIIKLFSYFVHIIRLISYHISGIQVFESNLNPKWTWHLGIFYVIINYLSANK